MWRTCVRRPGESESSRVVSITLNHRKCPPCQKPSWSSPTPQEISQPLTANTLSTISPVSLPFTRPQRFTVTTPIICPIIIIIILILKSCHRPLTTNPQLRTTSPVSPSQHLQKPGSLTPPCQSLAPSLPLSLFQGESTCWVGLAEN